MKRRHHFRSDMRRICLSLCFCFIGVDSSTSRFSPSPGRWSSVRVCSRRPTEWTKICCQRYAKDRLPQTGKTQGEASLCYQYCTYVQYCTGRSLNAKFSSLYPTVATSFTGRSSTQCHVLLEGPVNDGYTLRKRWLNFSISGPSCTIVLHTLLLYMQYYCTTQLLYYSRVPGTIVSPWLNERWLP
jgi:hypothetical protein